MNNQFDRKLTYNGVTFQLTDKSTLDEREIHTYHELLYFIEGEAELLSENNRRMLTGQSLLVIPKQTYHFMRVLRPQFLRLKISVPQSLEGQIPISDLMRSLRVIEHFSDGVNFVLHRILQLMRDGEGEKTAFYTYAAFLMLLEEIDTRVTENDGGAVEQLGSVPKIIRYVAQNLGGDLSIAAIAAALNISPSGVIHSFKKELGISLHNYITQRRLIFAREQIIKGYNPTKIYLDCGYLEYSSFYRAYVKFFGVSPSREKTSSS